MTDKDFRELKELILRLDKKVDVGLTEINAKVDVGFTEINKKVEIGLTEINKKVDVGLTEINKKVDVGLTETNKKVDVGFTEIKGELKRIEQKLDNKLDGYEKRLASAEFISRASVTAIFIGFAGLVGGLAKLIFFSN